MTKTILRATAKDQTCLVRLPGVCSHDDETTVLAHLNGAGIAIKHNDLFGAFCCSACHDHLDRRIINAFSPEHIALAHYEAMHRTQQWWLDHGYIQIVNAPQPKIQKILPRRL
jgi:hypothetical protein